MWYKIKKIYQWTNLVRPIWKPNANTIAYYPLTSSSTVNDMSGNNKTLTNNGWVTFWNYSWVDCAYLNWSSYLKNTYTDFNVTQATINIWIKRTRSATEYFAWLRDNSPDTQVSIYGDSSNKIWIIYYQSSWKYNWYTTWITSAWMNLVLTVNWSWNKMYYNWNLLTLSYSNWSSSTWLSSCTSNNITIGSHQWGNSWKLNWYISNVIIEDKVWTADEVLNYYNQTKSNYWL